MIPLVDLKAQYHSIKPEIDAAIQRVLESCQFIQGPEVAAFEADFARINRAPHAIGLGSGTVALQLTLEALGVSRGDEVITSAHTFIATAEAIREAGATPVFVDIDPQTYNIDPNLIEAAITERTRAIVPVHLYGQSADMPAIMALARRYNLVVVEDAAQAHLATFRDTSVGLWGDAGIFSFFPAKNLGAYGDAGAVITDNAELAHKLRLMRDHGRDAKYVHTMRGTGARLDALQAAILAVKLRHLPQWTRQRQRIAGIYRIGLQGVDSLVLPYQHAEAAHVYHLFVLRSVRRDELQAHLKANGISSGIHYPVPLHLQPALEYLGYKPGDLPHTELAANSILSLPMYPELSPAQTETIIQAVRDFANTLSS